MLIVPLRPLEVVFLTLIDWTVILLLTERTIKSHQLS